MLSQAVYDEPAYLYSMPVNCGGSIRGFGDVPDGALLTDVCLELRNIHEQGGGVSREESVAGTPRIDSSQYSHFVVSYMLVVDAESGDHTRAPWTLDTGDRLGIERICFFFLLYRVSTSGVASLRYQHQRPRGGGVRGAGDLEAADDGASAAGAKIAQERELRKFGRFQ